MDSRFELVKQMENEDWVKVVVKYLGLGGVHPHPRRGDLEYVK